jgi:probable phosphomutase (TIGR03848 family)
VTTFFFVRHGLTEHTGHKLSGWLPGVHLSEEGLAQVQEVAGRLANVPFKAIYSSPIERTMETARAIAEHHDLDVEIAPAIGEVRYGKWTNRSFKALTRTKLWTTLQKYPSAARFPDGETLRAVQARAVDEVEALRLKHPKKTVCCVTHADVIRLVAAHYLGIHIDLFQRISVAPASVTVVAISDEGPRVLALNSLPSMVGVQ